MRNLDCCDKNTVEMIFSEEKKQTYRNVTHKEIFWNVFSCNTQVETLDCEAND